MADPLPPSPALRPCPFCGGAMQFRKALWPGDGCTDAIVHAEPTSCGLSHFDIGTTDESVIATWNNRGRGGLSPSELVCLEGDDIIIRITPDALTFASENGVLCTFSVYTNDFRRVKVTDKAAWRAAIVRALRREQENGDTPVHLMLDQSLEWAADQGEEGIEIEGLLP